jgi:hypothetical protein
LLCKKEDDTDKPYSINEGDKNAIKILFRIPEWRRPLVMPRIDGMITLSWVLYKV